ncbi:MAG: glycosyltransferase family 2 protein [Candidatus Pacearchaeota archaeon]|nr:glycosyltransferase family 2 protein [Candidatus Pacearchaeota archaeon]
MKNKISACIVTYNEEKVIKRCLDSIKNVADEIVLVHDGPCKDRTLEIAKRYTNKIFIRPHIGMMEAHLVFAYNKTKYDWILRIDADEFLSKEAQKNIKELVQARDTNGYALLWRLWDGKKYITKSWPHKLCLFRKNKTSYLGFPHATEKVEGKVLSVNHELCHRPKYNNYSFKIFKPKWLRWAKVQATYTLKDFKEIPKFNYKKKDFKLATKLKREIPELLLIPLAIATFFKIYFFKGFYKIGLLGFNYAIMNAGYQAAICYYIYKLKNKRN